MPNPSSEVVALKPITGESRATRKLGSRSRLPLLIRGVSFRLLPDCRPPGENPENGHLKVAATSATRQREYDPRPPFKIRSVVALLAAMTPQGSSELENSVISLAESLA